MPMHLSPFWGTDLRSVASPPPYQVAGPGQGLGRARTKPDWSIHAVVRRSNIANLAARGISLICAVGARFTPPPLTGVGKNEIIATNRPRHLWIPAYAGMME